MCRIVTVYRPERNEDQTRLNGVGWLAGWLVEATARVLPWAHSARFLVFVLCKYAPERHKHKVKHNSTCLLVCLKCE